MLQTMSQPVPSAPSSPSFASLLASFSAGAGKPLPAWNNDQLASDVAVLSYERALRSNARYVPAESGDVRRPSSAAPERISIFEAAPAHGSSPQPLGSLENGDPGSQSAAVATPEEGHRTSTLADRNLKTASVTIRLSEAECAQLRTRAAESGLTVSAYLRSCTFEAESLRAQVKEALAHLRSSASPPGKGVPVNARASRTRWFHRLWPRAPSAGHAARA
jgi:hypothetical protein